jgi:hypothetical protein
VNGSLQPPENFVEIDSCSILKISLVDPRVEIINAFKIPFKTNKIFYFINKTNNFQYLKNKKTSD